MSGRHWSSMAIAEFRRPSTPNTRQSCRDLRPGTVSRSIPLHQAARIPRATKLQIFKVTDEETKALEEPYAAQDNYSW
jgi:hypothetical protein